MLTHLFTLMCTLMFTHMFTLIFTHGYTYVCTYVYKGWSTKMLITTFFTQFVNIKIELRKSTIQKLHKSTNKVASAFFLNLKQ